MQYKLSFCANQQPAVTFMATPARNRSLGGAKRNPGIGHGLPGFRFASPGLRLLPFQGLPRGRLPNTGLDECRVALAGHWLGLSTAHTLPNTVPVRRP